MGTYQEILDSEGRSEGYIPDSQSFGLSVEDNRYPMVRRYVIVDQSMAAVKKSS